MACSTLGQIVTHTYTNMQMLMVEWNQSLPQGYCQTAFVLESISLNFSINAAKTYIDKNSDFVTSK